jgi:hypothetical protein
MVLFHILNIYIFKLYVIVYNSVVYRI